MKTWALLIISVMAVRLGWAGTSSGAAFLKIQPSVRNYALGGNHPALSFGSQSIGSNPGNMVLQKTPYEMTTAFANMIGDSGFGHVAATVRSADKKRAWGAHLTYLRSGSMEGRDDNGVKTKNFNSQDVSAGVSAAEKFGKSFRAGLTVKAVKETIDSESSNTVLAGDVGVSAAMSKALVGISANNVGSAIKLGTRSAKLPTSYNAGVAVEMGEFTALVGAGRWVNEQRTSVNLGVEYRLGPISLRAGYRDESGKNLAMKSQGTGDQFMTGLTGGFGVQRGAWKLDYAIAQTAVEYGMSHRVGLTMMWGGEAAKHSLNGRIRTVGNYSGKTWVR